MAQILVIDDDTAICRMIETALTRDGHRVQIKNSAAELEIQALKKIDLILEEGASRVRPKAQALIKDIKQTVGVL